MRDGNGNKLSETEAEKVKATEAKPDASSLNKVSVDPKTGEKATDNAGLDKSAPASPAAPRS